LQIKALNDAYVEKTAKEFNVQIDKGLEAYREKHLENKAGLESSARQEQGANAPLVSLTRSPRQPNRYAALVAKQNYAERAKQAELGREKEQDPTRQPPRDRGRER
jgi:hypothetical protein